ncbi:MAG: MFS transporter [Halioglobus sp.]|nr:MFS transporter [Halioglobus sp.]
MSNPNSPEHYIHARSFSGFQILAIGLCALINVFDGFDALAIAFTAPAIAAEWRMSPAALGIVFSAGYLGMALGAMTLGTLSDRIGRRNMILYSLAALTLTMGLTATANSVASLLAYRLGSGLAIGAMLASITALTAEYSPDSKRNFTICIVQGTYAVGATLGGLLSAYLIEDYGWRSVFGVGAALNAGLFVLVYCLMPESLAFLFNKRPAGSLVRVNAIIERLGGRPLAAWPAPSVEKEAATGVKALLQPGSRRWSLLLWVATFSAMFGNYFLLSWIPKIVVDAGLSLENAIWVGMSINAGGLCGILWLGYRSAVSGLRFMIAAFMVTAGILMMAFGFLGNNVAALMAVAVAMGFFGQAGFIGLYSVAARLYPAHVRATGIGWAIGLGRIGAIIGPSVAGLLIGLGWERPNYFMVLAIPFFVGATAIWLVKSAQLDATVKPG